MRVLLTRPEPDAAELGAALAALGHEVRAEPLLHIVPLPVDAGTFADAQAIIATSRNGLRALAASKAIEDARTLPVFAVGPATAELARESGFHNVIAGPGAARDLVPLIAAHCDVSEGDVVHVAGETLAFDLVAALAAEGITVRTLTAYRAEPAAALSAEAVRAIAEGGLDAVILMSPRTADIYAKLVDAAGIGEAARHLTHVCLSPAAAAGLAALAPPRIEIAAEPNSTALLAAVARVATHFTGV
jgi:uroporphyrinogen-III synthase